MKKAERRPYHGLPKTFPRSDNSNRVTWCLGYFGLRLRERIVPNRKQGWLCTIDALHGHNSTQHFKAVSQIAERSFVPNEDLLSEPGDMVPVLRRIWWRGNGR